MNVEVEQAIEETRITFPGHRMEVEPDKDGGAYVIVHDLVLGERFKPSRTWCGFHITFQYPHGDVYPHFIDPSVKRADGTDIPRQDGVSGPVQWQERSALQLSRRSRRWNAAVDTAAIKLLKVLEWFIAK